MPGFNGNGPLGDGPMTGRGLGLCNKNKNLGRGQGLGLGRGRGLGLGRGQGLGRRRGFGLGFVNNTNDIPVPNKIILDEELVILNKEKEEIERRIKELQEGNK